MISKSDIVEAIRVQRERLRKFQSFRRDLLLSLPPLVADYALIISGIRRCGKSTLLAQFSVDRYKPEEVLSLNFDTPLLYGFEFSDFRIVDEVIKEHEGCIALLFDEIQIVDGRRQSLGTLRIFGCDDDLPCHGCKGAAASCRHPGSG